MPRLNTTIEEFLAQKRIAVAGVSRSGSEAANLVYRKLRDAGYEVFAINPNTDQIEGDPCFASLSAIPGEVDGVVIATQPKVTDQIVQECAQLGISRVWMHRSFGQGSVSDEAVDFCQQNNIKVIAGGVR